MTRERIELAEHFEDLGVQRHAAELGMWLFLATELLLFGGLFGLYAAYHAGYEQEFVAAAAHNDTLLGTINTFVLITSSLTVAWAIHSTRNGRNRAAIWSLAITWTLGIVFLVLKLTEYSHHFSQGVFPGAYYRFAELPSEGAKIFFTLYYLMTGLHALHVIAGLGVITVLLVLAMSRRYTPDRHTSLELGGLYWHLIDVIWIFLWPLMYLAR